MFKTKIDNPHNRCHKENSKKKDEKYQPSLALVNLTRICAMKNGGGKAFEDPPRTREHQHQHFHKQQNTVQLPPARTHSRKQANVNASIQNLARFRHIATFVPAINYKLFCSFLNRLQLYVIYKEKSIKDIFTKKRSRAYTLSKIFNTNLLFSFSETSTIVYCIKFTSSTANNFTLMQLTVRKILN